MTNASIVYELPRPIAQALEKAQNAYEKAEQASGYRDVLELAVRYTVLVGCARAFPPDSPEGAQSASSTDHGLGPLSSGKSITLGGWVSMLGDLERTLQPQGEAVAGAPLDEKRADLPCCLDLVRHVDETYKANRVSMRIALAKLTELRNIDAHGLGSKTLKDILGPYGAAIEELLLGMPVLRDWDLVRVEDVRKVKAGLASRWEASSLRMMGVSQRRDNLDLGTDDRGLLPDTLYVRHRASDRWVVLSPFIIVIVDGDQVFFLEGFKDRGAGQPRRPVYRRVGATDEPAADRIDQAAVELRARARFLFSLPPPPPRRLPPEAVAALVQAVAIDGRITIEEQDFLAQMIRQLDATLDDVGVQSTMLEAIEKLAPGVIVDERVAATPTAAPATPIEPPVAPRPALASPAAGEAPPAPPQPDPVGVALAEPPAPPAPDLVSRIHEELPPPAERASTPSPAPTSPVESPRSLEFAEPSSVATSVKAAPHEDVAQDLVGATGEPEPSPAEVVDGGTVVLGAVDAAGRPLTRNDSSERSTTTTARARCADSWQAGSYCASANLGRECAMAVPRTSC
jgi:hypothetical protein